MCMFLFWRGERSCHGGVIWLGRQWSVQSFLEKTGADPQPQCKGNDCMLANQFIRERM
jgi:hypothetical protein